MSASKTESGFLRTRTIGQGLAWLQASVPSLSERDVIVANVGAHFVPALNPTTRTSIAAEIELFGKQFSWHNAKQQRSTPPHAFVRQTGIFQWEGLPIRSIAISLSLKLDKPLSFTIT